VPGLEDVYLDTALDDSRTNGVAGQTCDVMDVEFAHEMLPVLVHRFEAHAQFRGDLFVGMPSAMSWSTSTSRELRRLLLFFDDLP